MAITWLEQSEPCDHCGRLPREGERNSGPRMWSIHQFTCRHEVKQTCPECHIDKNLFSKCSQCGRDEEYT